MHRTETAAVQREAASDVVREPAERAPSLSLILPAWNESDVIAKAVAEADAALSGIAVDYEIIVVDDGSTDDTAAIVRMLSRSNEHVRLVQHSPNRGYGAAIRSGFAAAQHQLVVFTDADCQFDLKELDRFVLLAKRYDIVCGYRIDRKDTPIRCLYSKVYNLLVRALLGTGVRDVDCALKMFHRDVAKELRISGNGFLVNSEMLVQAKQLGCSLVEVGVSHRPRTLGESTVSIAHIPKVLKSLVRYWWNEAQFPQSNSLSATGNRSDNTCAQPGLLSVDRWLQIGLLLVAALFILTNLAYPLIDRDETRYAEIPREMLATGNWILPQLNFKTYYDKPPLLYWLCAISFKWFGISEMSARLVPALAALATLASTMFFGSRIFGQRIGLIAGLVLMLSVGFAFTSRYLLLDGLLSLFVTLSLFTAYEAIRDRQMRLGWWVASGVFVALAFLTKGPVAIVLWLPPVFAMAWLSNAHARPRWWHYAMVGVVAAMIAGPWFVLVNQQDPMFLYEFFYKHNFARFAGAFHAKPIWYFVPVLLVAGHPWSFLTVPYARFLFGRDERKRARRPPEVGYLLLWSAWCFVFFSISQCKLPTYLLPAAPALSLMIGHYLNEVFRDSGSSGRHFFARFWSARSATAATCLAGVALVAFVIVSTEEPTVMLFGWAMLWATLLLASLSLLADRYLADLGWGTSTCVAFLLAVMVMHQLVPAYSHSNSLFGQDSPLADPLAAGRQLPIATVDHEFAEIPFYLNRDDITNFASVHDAGLGEFVTRSGAVMLIVDERIAAKELRRQLPETTHLSEVWHRGSARIYQVTPSAISTNIASVPDKAMQGARR